MAKIEKCGDTDRYMFFCPGCKTRHTFNDTWIFNQNYEKPTISPSILVTTNSDPKLNKRCHSFIKDGTIQFLSDCHHELKGQTVDLEDLA